MKIIKELYYYIFSFLVLPIIWFYIRKFGIKNILSKDVERYFEEGAVESINGFTVSILFLRRELCFRDIFYFRCHHRCYLLRLFFKPYPSLVVDNGVEIEGGGLFFHHPFSTYINAAYIGYGCTFRNNTTIGNKVKDGVVVAPRLMGYNDIGVNACIIGGITIGEHSTVGAGSVVVKDVPANAIVAGNPARIIKFI